MEDEIYQDELVKLALRAVEYAQKQGAQQGAAFINKRRFEVAFEVRSNRQGHRQF